MKNKNNKRDIFDMTIVDNVIDKLSRDEIVEILKRRKYKI